MGCRLFLLWTALGLAWGCAHDKAWVSEKSKRGGAVGYAQSTFDDDREAVIRDFKKAARKICGTRDWVIVREVIPPPTDAVSAVRNAGSGDVRGAVDSGAQATIHDAIYRSRRLHKDVKVEYGSPFKSWNEAEIRCTEQAKAKS